MKKAAIVVLALVAAFMLGGSEWTALEAEAAESAPGSVAERREEVLRAAGRGAAAIPQLESALQDESPLVRRAAVRALIGIGGPAEGTLARALDNEDIVVRRAALAALVKEPVPGAAPYLEKAAGDVDVSVREMAVNMLVAVEPRTERIEELLKKAAQDAAPQVQRVAVRALNPFQIEPREVTLLRDRPEVADHLERIVKVFEMRFPRDGWKFKTDPGITGHLEEWFNPEFEDSDWEDYSIERAWLPGYIGVGWYRHWFELPDRPEHLAVELLFEGVDENAWIWINGEYVGGQDIGPSGWNRPFRVDVTQELQWGQRNQITVRAMNTVGAGGIWRPVTLEALGMRR